MVNRVFSTLRHFALRPESPGIPLLWPSFGDRGDAAMAGSAVDDQAVLGIAVAS
jgi:hypothetical protein